MLPASTFRVQLSIELTKGVGQCSLRVLFESNFL